MFSRTSPGHSLSRFFGRNPYCPVFFNAHTGGSEPGGDNNQSQNNTSQNQSQNNQSQNDQGVATLSAVQKLVEDVRNSNRANGDWEEVANILAGKIVAKSKSANDPDQVAISKDEHVLLQSAQSLLQAFNVKNFDELKQRIEAGDSASQSLTKRERDDARNKVVQSAGFDPDKFGALAFANDYEYYFETETINNEKVEIAYGKRSVNGKEEKKRVTDIVKERSGGLEEALKPATGDKAKPRTVKKHGAGPGIGAGRESQNVFAEIRERNQTQAQAEQKESFVDKARKAGMTRQ